MPMPVDMRYKLGVFDGLGGGCVHMLYYSEYSYDYYYYSCRSNCPSNLLASRVPFSLAFTFYHSLFCTSIEHMPKKKSSNHWFCTGVAYITTHLLYLYPYFIPFLFDILCFDIFGQKKMVFSTNLLDISSSNSLSRQTNEHCLEERVVSHLHHGFYIVGVGGW